MYIYIYIYIYIDKKLNLISHERHTTRDLKKYPSRVVAYPSNIDFTSQKTNTYLHIKHRYTHTCYQVLSALSLSLSENQAIIINLDFP